MPPPTVTASAYHEPVLCHAAVDALVTDPSGVYVDGTIGGGGHAEVVCSKLAPCGRLIGFDADPDAIAVSRARLADHSDRLVLVHANFSTLRVELQKRSIDTIHGLLLDLGVSSFQIDEPTKGFSYRLDGRLDMRFDRRQTLTAADVVNSYSEESLGRLLWEYGEVRNSRRLAKALVALRPITTTGQLVSAVSATAGGRFLTKTLARVFQAIRIEVNAELKNLSTTLTDAVGMLAGGGRMVVVSYHSLEDRIVKEVFQGESRTRIPSGSPYHPDRETTPRIRILTRKPVVPSVEEVRLNPRARSAKMRVAERCAGTPGGER